ncbi:hypothetical protein ACLOJK_028666 [Asimina triloba]
MELETQQGVLAWPPRKLKNNANKLKELTDLRGKLVIKKLENVTEAVDAELANLTNKPFIDHLSLEWSKDPDWSTQDEGLEEELVEGLQPHPSLKILELDGYMSTHFPSWMMKMDTCLSNLTALYLSNCRRCSILPPLGRFPSFKKFYLRSMDKLEQWQVESWEEIPCSNSLPNLTELDISGCARLVSLPGPDILPALTRLIISYCKGLNELPPLLPVLSYPPFTPRDLSHLEIRLMSSLTSMPRGMLQALTQLESLTIRGCNQLVTIEDEVLPLTLKPLKFWFYLNLKSLSRKGLPSLLERF